MIEFRGELSEGSKRYIQDNATRIGRYIVSMFFALSSIILVILTIEGDQIFGITIPIPIIIAILVLIPKLNSPMKVLNLYFPTRIVIDENGTGEINIEGVGEDSCASRNTVDVKKLNDLGEFYHRSYCNLLIKQSFPIYSYTNNCKWRGNYIKTWEKILYF